MTIPKTFRLVAACCGLALLAPIAQASGKPEDIIKARQAAYQFLAWNTGRVRANVENPATYDKDTVVKAANAIAAIANSGLGALYVPGTETGTGYAPTRVKPEAFDPAQAKKLGEIAGNFNREANALATVAATGNPAAVKAQLGKLSETCKACHDGFRNK